MFLLGLFTIIVIGIAIVCTIAGANRDAEKNKENFYSEDMTDDEIRKENQRLKKEIDTLKRGNIDPMRNPVNRGIAKFGDKMVGGGIVPAFLVLDGLNQIKKSVDETQKKKLKRLDEELKSADMFSSYHSYDD